MVKAGEFKTPDRKKPDAKGKIDIPEIVNAANARANAAIPPNTKLAMPPKKKKKEMPMQKKMQKKKISHQH